MKNFLIVIFIVVNYQFVIAQNVIDFVKSKDYKYYTDTVYWKNENNGMTVNYYDSTKLDDRNRDICVGSDEYYNQNTILSVHRYNIDSNFPIKINYFFNGRIESISMGDKDVTFTMHLTEDQNLSSYYTENSRINRFTKYFDNKGNPYDIFEFGENDVVLNTELVKEVTVNTNNFQEYYYYSGFKVDTMISFLKRRPLFVNVMFLPRNWIDSTQVNILINLLGSDDLCNDLQFDAQKSEFDYESKITIDELCKKLIYHYLTGYYPFYFTEEKVKKVKMFIESW
ncbi:hypothetical protein [Crocinitomix catalasitica]|uniref:hypothetical protein n=1 Tax=Crocinitomix catalasitica TaxID=184607 RepID=UPI000480B681|nr:hypothetical protein [Crocinitomix catalasitica]